MNKIKTIFLCAILGIWSQTADASLFKAQEFTLENGLHCVIVENHKAPLVMQMLWYKAGSVDEQKGKGGSAHLLEHLMFRGTKFAGDGEFNRIMEKYGVSDNAFTSHDVTAYRQFADVRNLEVLLAMEADRMRNLDFTEKAFNAERSIVYQERMQRVENNPSSPFYEQMNLILWGNSPYGQPVTGLPEEITELQSDDVMSFYNKYYTPSNAVLVISGDVSAAQIRPLIEKYYGGIKSHKVEHKKHAAQMRPLRETLEMGLPDVASIKMYERCLLPNHKELKNKIYDYAVLAEYLGGGATSALYKDLVLRQKKALSVGASYLFVSRGESVFSYNMIPQNQLRFDRGEMFDALKTAADEAVDELDEKKLARLKRKISADLVFVNDNPSDAAEWIGAMIAAGFTLDDVQNYETNLNAVTVQGVKEAYDALKNAPCLSAVLLPQAETDAKRGENE